nr:unnamed protein product [Callosobruchus chinensis]
MLLQLISRVKPLQPRRLMGYFHQNRDQYWLERVGTREMVGFGINGTPSYVDKADFPFPAIRYKETTPEIQALYEKQKGNWKLLTKEEKKALYRSNFCQTYSEMLAPTGEWMRVMGGALIMCSIGVWIFIAFYLFVIERKKPESFKPSHKRAQLRRIIDMQADPILGMCADWDYEKMDWKVKRWWYPSNPFVKCLDDQD